MIERDRETKLRKMPLNDIQTNADRLAQSVADAIIAGTLHPGSRLDEHGLAGRYGVSRTPVREALRQLAAMGLVEIRPRRGAVVASLNPSKLEMLFAEIDPGPVAHPHRVVAEGIPVMGSLGEEVGDVPVRDRDAVRDQPCGPRPRE